jgi:GntR family transcriptional regulator / MocR family aminotransferase
MHRSWSISGIDLLLPFGSDLGRRQGLEQGLRQAIRDGRLPPGARLPSTRVLAHDLGVARGTVSDAYAQLVAEGYLVARQGSGTTVAAGPVLVVETAPASAARTVPRADFRTGTPDLSSFPRTAWMAAARRAVHEAPDDAFGYGDPRGRIELRRALAAYLGRARGVRATPERIVVCNGYTQVLAILCSVLRSQGAGAVAMEDPCIPVHREIVAASGLEIVGVPVDSEGARIDTLAGQRLGAVVVTPAHQFPLGVTMAPSRRSALIRWARSAGAFVIEDDYDGEFRYDRQPVGALQGLDPDRVIYAGTASKTLAPGLRLAWLVIPASLMEPVVQARLVTDRHSGVIDQLTIACLIESGEFDRHVRRMRMQYRRRRDLLVAALAERVPALRPSGIAAGLHALLMLPSEGPSEGQVLAEASARGVALYELGPSWHAPGGHPGGVVIGYATPPQHGFTSALELLVDTFAALYPV